MSEREREAKWVLVPESLDDETLARLVKEPVHLYGQDGRGKDYQARMKVAVMIDRAVAQQQWRDALAALPPIPPDVWEQMVERGARAALEAGGTKWKKRGDLVQSIYKAEAAACLRAALGISDE